MPSSRIKSETQFHDSLEKPSPNDAVRPVDIINESAPLPSFGEDVWDLRAACSPASQSKSSNEWVVGFSDIPTEYRKAVRQWCFWRLTGRIPSSAVPSGPLKPNSIGRYLRDIRRYLEFKPEKRRMELTSTDIVALYDQVVLESGEGPAARMVTTLRSLHAFRYDLDVQLTSMKFPDIGTRRVISENRTPRVPEKVMDAVFRAAMIYVDHASADIIESRKWLTNAQSNVCSNLTADEVDQRLTVWLRKGLQIPGRFGRGVANEEPLGPSISTIALRIGVPLTQIQKGALRQRIDSAGEERGLSRSGLLEAEPNFVPQLGAAWHPRGLDTLATKDEGATLVHACLIVLGYLTGMRISEVHSLTRSSAVVDMVGSARRFKFNGRTFKKRRAEGEDATWVTIEQSHKALSVLFELFSAHGPSPTSETIGEALSRLGIGTDLHRFVRHVNRLWSSDEETFVPTHEGNEWKLASSQLRRTLAWHIAARPFGIVALKIQYQHLSSLTAEGYAGTSKSGFGKEIEEETEIANAQLLLSLMSRSDNDSLDDRSFNNPALAADLKAIHEIAQTVDAHEAEELVRQLGIDLHQSPFNYCLFDKAKAKCWQGTPLEDRDGPRLLRCIPTSCGNAAINNQHHGAWESELDQVKVLLAGGPSGTMKEVLQQRRDIANEALCERDESEFQ